MFQLNILNRSLTTLQQSDFYIKLVIQFLLAFYFRLALCTVYPKNVLTTLFIHSSHLLSKFLKTLPINILIWNRLMWGYIVYLSTLACSFCYRWDHR